MIITAIAVIIAIAVVGGFCKLMDMAHDRGVRKAQQNR